MSKSAAGKNTRMFLVTNSEQLKKRGTESHLFEFEVTADSHIAGHFDDGIHCLGIWEFGLKGEGETRRLYLRVRSANIPYDEVHREQSTDAFYHGGGLADEVIMLASLFLRRRLKLGPMVRVDNTPRLYTDPQGFLDRPIIAGETNLVELEEWFDLVKRLDPRHHQKFILATKLYHQAVLILEGQPDLAYLNLVSAIEALCQEEIIAKVRLSEVKPRLAKALELIADEGVRSRIEQAALESERFIGRRFVTFILRHVDDGFWTREGRPSFGRIEPHALPGLLKRIYDQRSKTLHEGQPFPAYIFSPPGMGAEVEFALAVGVGYKTWSQKTFIPNVFFFEHLVNYVLKSFVKANAIKPRQRPSRKHTVKEPDPLI